MQRLIPRLRKDLLDMQGLLAQGRLPALDPGERQAAAASSEKLLERLDALSDQVLVAGLVGGTGVGKSTVMNALAGSEISSTSHRRPNTGRVILYRHEEAELPPSLPKTMVPWQEVLHRADPVRQIVLCDLPDFDSFAGEHRERVLRFLEHLDVLVFVTSPEKYADHSLYAFLRDVPKARPNFTFVLNKVDLLFRGEDLEAGYRQLESLVGMFQGYLQKADVPEPVLFAVSAEEALRNPSARPWNQFSAFRREIFRDREAKEVMAIKSANLDGEVQAVRARLQGERGHIDSLERVLGDFLGAFEKTRAQREKQGQEILDVWVDARLQGHAVGRLETLAPLVGPGYWIARMVREWRSWKEGKGGETGQASTEEIPDPPAPLLDLIEGVEEQVVRKALQGSVPAPYLGRLRATLDLRQAWGSFSAGWARKIERGLRAQRTPWLVGFRIVQYAFYLALLVLLLAALADEDAGRWLLREPGPASSFQVLFSIVKSLFSMSGLGALLAFGLIEIFLGARFYRRYRARLQKRARRTLDSLKGELGRLWSAELDRLEGALRDCRAELVEQSRLLSGSLDRD
jgi:GTP-binding protein EngB required for normal cell division